MRKTIILVHGTFARNTLWVRENSSLYRGLVENVVDVLSIKAFQWSGWNSPAARLKASMDLRAQLEQELEAHPDQHLIVIGHSHGGTVAMRAADCDRVRESVSVVCLATPFLQVFPRSLPKGVFVQIIFAFSMLLAMPFNPGTVGRAFAQYFHLWRPNFLDAFDVGGGIAYLWIVLTVIIFASLHWIYSRLEKNANTVAGQIMHQPELPAPAVLLLRVAGDEASSWISIFQVLSWLSSRIAGLYVAATSALLNRLVSIGVRLRKITGNSASRAWTFTIVTALALLFIDLKLDPRLHWLGFIFAYAALAWVIVMLAYHTELLDVSQEASFVGFVFFPILVLLVPISIIFAIFGIFAFGGGTGLLVFFFEVSVEGSPIGTWRTLLIPPMPGGNLRHSQIYENQSVLAELNSWINLCGEFHQPSE